MQPGGAPAVLIPKFADLCGCGFTESLMGDVQLAQTPEGWAHIEEISVSPPTYPHTDCIPSL